MCADLWYQWNSLRISWDVCIYIYIYISSCYNVGMQPNGVAFYGDVWYFLMAWTHSMGIHPRRAARRLFRHGSWLRPGFVGFCSLPGLGLVFDLIPGRSIAMPMRFQRWSCWPEIRQGYEGMIQGALDDGDQDSSQSSRQILRSAKSKELKAPRHQNSQKTWSFTRLSWQTSI